MLLVYWFLFVVLLWVKNLGLLMFHKGIRMFFKADLFLFLILLYIVCPLVFFDGTLIPPPPSLSCCSLNCQNNLSFFIKKDKVQQLVLRLATGSIQLLMPFFQAPELHVEIHKHGFGQQQQQQAAATAGSSTSASTNVILKRFCCLSLPCDYSVSGFCS